MTPRDLAVRDYILGLADDALVLSHRCAEWVTRAPQLEEDVAMGNIGLDLLGQARVLLARAGEVEGAGRDEDDLAYLRDPHEFRNVLLVEQPNGDFAFSMARLLVVAAYQLPLYRALSTSSDEVLAGVAAKAVKEVDYHLDHATQWVLRLGDGTDLSHERMQAGLDDALPWAGELFDRSWVDPVLLDDGTAVDAVALLPQWEITVRPVVAEATLTWRQGAPHPGGGRRGEHTSELTTLLAQMQELRRAHAGASW